MDFPRLYFVTDKHLGSSMILEPRIPEFTSSMEDQVTPRICVASTIQQCLTAIEVSSALETEKVNEKIYYVYYTTYDDSTTVRPTSDEVSDAYSTGELWILEPDAFFLIGAYKLTKGERIGNSCYRRYYFTKAGCDPVVSRVCASVVYGDIDAFSYIDYDMSLRESALEEIDR